MKSILVTTDFSAHSDDTLRYVLKEIQATKDSSRVLLVNTYLLDFSSDPQNFLTSNDLLKSESIFRLNEQTQRVLKDLGHPQIRLETTSHLGSLPNVVLNLVKKEHIQAVVLGEQDGKYADELAPLLLKNNCKLLDIFNHQRKIVFSL